MKKRGFTLIELLAVIVILAIIALIATPIVMNVIENTKKGAAERTAENYVAAVELAVMKEKLNNPEVINGTYGITKDGNLCADGATNCHNPITIDMNGNKPTSGTILIENGLVSQTSKIMMSVEGYIVRYNVEKKTFVATKEKKICRPTTEATTGNIPSGNYGYGDEYICDPGDGIERIFFILEDGDNPNLIKGDGTLSDETDQIGTAGDGQVALIMNQNIDKTTVAWCSSGTDSSCNADGAREHLNSLTSEWSVEVNLPTYNQIKAANNGKTNALPLWLYDYSNSTLNKVPGSYGYWTSSAISNDHSNARNVFGDGFLYYASVGFSTRYGVRPVITISKNQLG